MTTVCTPADTLYASNFWSVDTSSQSTLMNQHEKSTKTLHLLSAFYKEFTNLESEYSRKFNSLISRLDIPKYESSGTLKTSLDVFQEQCMKIAESHTLQSRRVQDSLQTPLLDLISERKAREKAIENKIYQAWTELESIKAQCENKSLKFESIWNEMSSLKSTRLTLDHRESQKLEEKLSSLKVKMLKIREENWELVNKYNEKLDAWVLIWWNTCNDLQNAEEKRIRFLKSNLWEFSNICSTFCVEEDQYAECMRVSLQDCSAKKDISYFVSHYQTGDSLLSPMNFVDFAKNETRSLHHETTRKFKIQDFPKLQNKTRESHKTGKKNPPPELTENGETAFSYISRSKETFKKLQEEAQNEVSQTKLSRPKSVSSNKSTSEPSTYKVMSDYSNPTAQTSISSHSFNDQFEEDAFFQKKSSEHNDSKNKDENSNDSFDKTITKSFDEKLTGFKNQDIFRDSMSPSKDKSKAEKHNSFAALVKNAFHESPKRRSANIENQVEYKQILPQFNKINETLSNENDTSYDSQTQKQDSNSKRNSKSQMNTKNKDCSSRELPSISSEGYPVIMHAKAQFSYTAAIEEELSFKKRDILLILHKQPDGWWFAENLNSGDSGLVPSNYLTQVK